MSRPGNLASRMLPLVAVAPAIAGLCFVLIFGVNVPVMDQWGTTIAGLFVKAHQGRLTLADFLAQHNEHRIIIPRLIIFVLGTLSHWNTVLETVVEWLVMCATSLGILWLSWQSSSTTLAERRFLDAPVLLRWTLSNLLIFAPQQYENTLMGLGLCNVMPVFFIVAGLVIVRSGLHPWIRKIGGMAAAAAATLSLGNGIVAWPLVGIVLAWPSTRAELKGKIWMLLAWLAGFVLLAGLYAVDYRPAPSEARATAYFASPIRVIDYTVNFLGNAFVYSSKYPFATSRTVGAFMVLLLLGSAIHFLWLWLARGESERCGAMLVWFALAGYAIFSGFIAALFRGGLGLAQAESSRYITFSIYLPVALVNLVPMICADLQSRRPPSEKAGWSWRDLQVGLAAALLVLYVQSLPQALTDLAGTRRSRLLARADLLLINLFPENPRLKINLTVDPAQTAITARALNEIGYIHPALITSRDASRIQLIPDVADASSYGGILDYGQSGGNLFVVGKATKPGTSDPADAVFLTYDSDVGEPTIFAVAEQGVRRADQPPEEMSIDQLLAQWTVAFPPTVLPNRAGAFIIRAWQLDGASGKAICLPGSVNVNK